MKRNISIYSLSSSNYALNAKGKRSTRGSFLHSCSKIRFIIPLICTLLGASQLQAQWSSLGNGLDLPGAVWGISAPDSMTIWATTWDDVNIIPYDKICKTSDGGESWEVFEVEVSLSNYINSIFALDDQTAWVLGGDFTPPSSDGEIYKTSDGGNTWTHQATAFTGENHMPWSIHFYDENEGVAFGAVLADITAVISVYRTFDGGSNWTQVPVDQLPAQITGEGMSAELGNGNHAIAGDNIWFPTTEGRVFYSNDRGDSWSVADPELNGETPNNVISIAMRDSLHGLLISNEPNEVFRTSDGGVTWEDTEFTNDIFPIYQVSYVPGTFGTYLMHDGWSNDNEFVLMTTDEGLTWTLVDSEASVSCIEFLSPTVGFAGGYIIDSDEGGLYKWDSPVPTLLMDSEFPDGPLNVFPNPVKDELHIQWSPEVQAEQISIYDSLGKRLLTQGASDVNSILSIDVSALKGGSYIIELRSKDSISMTHFTKL